jgi:hypothetical protein
MSFDKRFYGTYQAICVNNDDPDERGRITMQIPQILGEAVTGWASPIGGAISQWNYPYGTFSSDETQLVTGEDIATIADFDIIEDINNIELVDSTKITVLEGGDYFFQFSAQFYKTGSSTAQADIWLRKNGIDIPRTNSRATLQGNPNEVLITLAYILDLEPEDYVEIVFSSADDAVRLVNHSSLTTPTRPNIPSIIATINLVGKYKPKPGTVVWASFLGGDPNFPLWIGAI